MDRETAVEGRRSEVEGQVDGPNGANAASGTPVLRVGGTPTPLSRGSKWREISGITVENEKTLSPKERRAAIRKLKAVVEQEIRAELKAAAEETEFKGEQTFLWEPIPAICHRLEIGSAVLSRLMKELTGMSATQMVDKIRAEGIKERLRASLRDFVRTYCFRPGVTNIDAGANSSQQLHYFWTRLKGFRQRNDFSYSTWAIELGFANYTRFYRACLLQYQMTPSQLEDAVLREYAEWYQVAADLSQRVAAKSRPYDLRYKPYRAPFDDRWAAALRERPEYVARMREEMELDESVREVTGSEGIKN